MLDFIVFKSKEKAAADSLVAEFRKTVVSPRAADKQGVAEKHNFSGKQASHEKNKASIHIEKAKMTVMVGVRKNRLATRNSRYNIVSNLA